MKRMVRKPEKERRLESELTHHLESLIAAHRAAGLSEAEARRQARLEFGALEAVKDDCRDARRTAFLEFCLQDLRLAGRALRKSPAFACAAMATLALGIGANTAIFQLLDTVFLRPLSVSEPQQLVTIRIRGGTSFGISDGNDRLTLPLFEGIRDHQQSFSRVAAWAEDDARTGIGPDTRQLPFVLASGDFFSMLRLAPAAGRLFDRSDDQPGCASPGIVLAYDFWRSEFGSRPSAIGQRLTVLDQPLEIIGVAPPAFTGLEVGQRFDFILPLCAQEILHHGDQHFTRRDVFWLNVMGRLKPGWTLEQASAQLLASSPGLFADTAPSGYSAKSIEDYKQFRLEGTPGASGVSNLRRQYRTSLYLLLGITALVLLIACANLANLMLARASSRRREFAVRVALGASGPRLLRQVLSEGLLLAAGGAAAGFLLAQLLSRGILTLLQTSGGFLHLDLAPDWRLLAFTAAVAVTACLSFSLMPAWSVLRTQPGETIHAGGRGLTADRGRFSFQRALIVVQVAVSLVLVTGALFLARSFRNLITLDPGFRTHGILIAAFDLSRTSLPAPQIKPTVASLLEEVRAVPQVEAAAATTNIIVNGGSWTLGLTGSLQGNSKFTWVSPGYFDTVEIPILAGRDFTRADVENGQKVAIVNQTFVRRYFPGTNPIGKTFRSAKEPGYPEAEYQIVGICKDTRYSDLRDTPPPQTYAPISQHPSYGPWAAFYIRSAAPLNLLADEIKRRINRSRPGVGTEFRVFQDEVRDSLQRERLLASLSGFFGALAAMLAAIGLYGVIAYIAVRRRNEIGIRMALGATRAGIVGLFLREAALLAAVGAIFGLAGALLFARAARSLLFGFSAYDPLTYGAAAALLAAVVALGSYLPARRAAGLDPLTALHYE